MTNPKLTIAIVQPVTTNLRPLLSEPSDLTSEYRRRRRGFDEKSVHPADVDVELAAGWEVQRPGKRRTRLKRPKPHNVWLEDRIWCLLHQMRYSPMSGHNFKITFQRREGSTGTKQIDVYAEDDETVLVVECKSRQKRGRRSLQKHIQETVSLQEYLRKTIFARFKGRPPPKVIWIYATNNIIWSQSDIDRALDGQIVILTENEIKYYETFIRHMGPAGKYQILAEFLKGQKIPGLGNIRVPAIRGKIGGQRFYSFVSTPEHLLKIAFINHQALNHADGRPAYQRMISAPRIREIGEYLKHGGFFPTNILVNFSDKPRFDVLSNKDNSDPTLKFGWLTLPSRYRSAWIIDGQHRLYGYSRLPGHLKQSLFVLAFEQMSVEKEADLFITINHKQKSVPKGLLDSLLADIRMGDPDPSIALSAVASAVVRALNTDHAGALSHRFAIPGMPSETSQNLTISEAVKGLRRSGLIGKLHRDVLTPGPLSGATDDETITRAATALGTYFERLRVAHPDRWESGRAAYVATNPAIRAHMIVIGQVIEYLSHRKTTDFHLMPVTELASTLSDFCSPIFEFLRSANDETIKTRFARRFGEGGVKEYTYYLVQILAESHEDFGNEEFRRWQEQSESQRIEVINAFLMKLAERMTDTVINTLKHVHGTHRLPSDERAYWELGVQNDGIRRKSYEKQQRDKGRRRAKEAYLDIVDLAEIVKQKNNWSHFQHVFNNPMPSERKGQKYYLSWIHRLNELRNIAAHRNQFKSYTDDDLSVVEWLRTEVAPRFPNDSSEP